MSNTMLQLTGKAGKNSHIVEELFTRFQDGEELSIKDVISMYCDEDNMEVSEFLMAVNAVRGIMQSLKTRFNNHGIWFGCIDNDTHTYGIPKTKQHVEDASYRYSRMASGCVRRQNQLVQVAKGKKIATVTPLHLQGIDPIS